MEDTSATKTAKDAASMEEVQINIGDTIGDTINPDDLELMEDEIEKIVDDLEVLMRPLHHSMIIYFLLRIVNFKRCLPLCFPHLISML